MCRAGGRHRVELMASERAGLSGHISERDVIAFLEYKELTRLYFIITSQTKMIQICHKTRGAVIPLFPDEQAVFYSPLFPRVPDRRGWFAAPYAVSTLWSPDGFPAGVSLTQRLRWEATEGERELDGPGRSFASGTKEKGRNTFLDEGVGGLKEDTKCRGLESYILSKRFSPGVSNPL